MSKPRLILVIAFAAMSCTERSAPKDVDGSAARDGVRRIVLPRYQSDLPDGPGRDAFAAACLSCHSTTYITMQPPMTAAKWEESARKMIKVYAAPIEEKQIPQVVAYLMAVKEQKQGAMTEVLATVTPQGKMRMVAPTKDPAKHAADMKHGATLFAQNCASCHGPRGAGDGATAATQFPRPTNLTEARFSVEALSTAIVRGVPATAMPGYPHLSDEDLRALVTFSQSLAPAAESLGDVTAEAKALFTQNCAACHGESGAGDGPLAATAPRPPANFHHVQPTRADAMSDIAEGVPATTMPPWKAKLNDAQREQLANYVRSFFKE